MAATRVEGSEIIGLVHGDIAEIAAVALDLLQHLQQLTRPAGGLVLGLAAIRPSQKARPQRERDVAPLHFREQRTVSI
jgi:hypothetical protein